MNKIKLLQMMLKLNKFFDDYEDSLRTDMIRRRDEFRRAKKAYERGELDDDTYFRLLEEYLDATNDYLNPHF